MKPLPKPREGYIGPDGVMRPELEEHLVVTVRERYARGAITTVAALELAVTAALTGDYATALDSPFRPCRMVQVIRP